MKISRWTHIDIDNIICSVWRRRRRRCYPSVNILQTHTHTRIRTSAEGWCVCLSTVFAVEFNSFAEKKKLLVKFNYEWTAKLMLQSAEFAAKRARYLFTPTESRAACCVSVRYGNGKHFFFSFFLMYFSFLFCRRKVKLPRLARHTTFEKINFHSTEWNGKKRKKNRSKKKYIPIHSVYLYMYLYRTVTISLCGAI